MEIVIKFLKALWQLVAYLFWPQKTEQNFVMTMEFEELKKKIADFIEILRLRST